jgi:hypothetical protein
MLRLAKEVRKWIIEGDGEGWIFHKKFPAKSKAEIAMRVFTDGGKVSDYWREARECAKGRPERVPTRVLEEMKGPLEAICDLNPRCDEIEEFAKVEGSAVVTDTEDNRYFPPPLHNTWGKKADGVCTSISGAAAII